jgi:tRNA pseudouridine13 synthase
MYKIKEKPEDFIVEEITGVEPVKKGSFSLWWMKKEDISTMEAVRMIAKKLRVRERFIGYAGAKDKTAVTKQLISVPRIPRQRIEKLNFDRISLEFYGYSENPVSLGDHAGNRFEIIVRNLDDIPKIKAAKIKNYFGEQRFSKDNAEIGRLIIKKDFRKAAEMMAENQKSVKEYLQDNETDSVGALRRIPLRLLKLYIHAYQSYIWNKAAEKIDDVAELPIIGFDTEIKDKKIKNIIEAIMEEEGLTYRDFIIKGIPEISAEGGRRELYVKPSSFETGEKEEDELNKGKHKIRLRFFLPKGSYATEVIKQIFI